MGYQHVALGYVCEYNFNSHYKFSSMPDNENFFRYEQRYSDRDAKICSKADFLEQMNR